MVKSILYNDQLIRLYNESSSSAIVSQIGCTNSYVVLGSKYYTLHSIMDKGYRPDMLEMNSFKDMYIYFIAYKDSNSYDQSYVIPDEYMPILNKLHKANLIPQNSWKSIQSGKIVFGKGNGDSVVNGWNVIRIGNATTPSR